MTQLLPLKTDSSSRASNGTIPLVTLPLETANLAQPLPTAYYYNPLGAPGCSTIGTPQRSVSDFLGQECSTIFQDLYYPYVAVPSELAALQDLWSTCKVVPAIAATPVAITEITASLVPLPTAPQGPGTNPKAKCAIGPRVNGTPIACYTKRKR